MHIGTVLEHTCTSAYPGTVPGTATSPVVSEFRSCTKSSEAVTRVQLNLVTLAVAPRYRTSRYHQQLLVEVPSTQLRWAPEYYTIAKKSRLFISRSCPILVLTTVLYQPRRTDVKNDGKNYQGPRKLISDVSKIPKFSLIRFLMFVWLCPVVSVLEPRATSNATSPLYIPESIILLNVEVSFGE